MKVTTEDRLIKSLGLLCLFAAIALHDPVIKLWVVLPLLAVSMVLLVRKYLRAKKNGEPLGRYYMAWGFLLLVIIIGYLFYWYAISRAHQ